LEGARDIDDVEDILDDYSVTEGATFVAVMNWNTVSYEDIDNFLLSIDSSASELYELMFADDISSADFLASFEYQSS
jgi:hypothetical protein